MKVVTADKILLQVDRDIELIKAKCEMATSNEIVSLSRDIKYLLVDSIAQTIWLSFYDPEDRESVFFKHVYSLEGTSWISEAVDNARSGIGSSIAFDAAIEFTETFIELDKKTQKLLLGNTELEWNPYY